MSSQTLEGNTLGKRQQHYNILVKEAIANRNQSTEPEKINIEESDVNNLMKIDIANNNRNVEYILEVLKCEDMLYVSRAIKKSTWLIIDNQYAHIINPEYLYSQLFPQMTSKAINKFMLHIRLNLKDEKRVEDFYDYQKVNNPSTASKWLPYCSLSFIESFINKNANNIGVSLLKRLCEKSITVLEIFVQKNRYYFRHALEAVMFLLYTNTEKYLDIIESVIDFQIPNFGVKPTKTIMTICPQRILNKFEIYVNNIDIPTFAKHLNTNVKGFLLKQRDNEKLQDWFQFYNLKHFAKYLPKEDKFEFLKQISIDIIYEKDVETYCNSYCNDRENKVNTSNDYCWYQYAPFNVAFTDLKKLIHIESSPDERNKILTTLLTCASRNLQHVRLLLQYYHDEHINEPFKFKNQFVINLISRSNTHEYDEKTWKILNMVFHSMEVYVESDNDVQTSIEAIIVYKVLHNENVPEMIEKKFSFNTLKKYQTKLKDEQRNQLFKYLCEHIQTKINSKDIEKSETVFKESFELLKNILKLLIDWEKELVDYLWVHDKIKEHIKIKIQKSWNVDLKSIYNTTKSWRKYMFELSLLLNPSEEVCLNALRQDPELLIRYKEEVDALCCDDNVSMKRFLRKLRIYWSQSLAVEWANDYLGRLEQPNGHRALIRGLCALLQQKDLLVIIKKYEPENPKIKWDEADKHILSLRKHIAKSMHLARPQPTPESILPYAKGDYLQFALCSLNAIFYNLNSFKSRTYILKLLDAPVSLQKHGIRLAFTKLNNKELKDVFSKLWFSTKNSSIRALLFKNTFDLLCKEKNATMIEEIYELLDLFIENLTFDENKSVYNTLTEIDRVPLLLRGKYCMKSYNFLKSLPAKVNCENNFDQVFTKTIGLVEYLDPDFVTNILLEYIENKYINEKNEHMEPEIRLMSSYLLYAKTEEQQTQKYKQVLLPLIERSLALWNELFFINENFNYLLKYLIDDYKKVFLKENVIAPTKLFTDIQTKLENTLSVLENYIMLRNWKLTVAFVKLLDKYTPMETNKSTPKFEAYDTDEEDFELESNSNTYNALCVKAAAEFGKLCHQYLKEDIIIYFPSIYLLFLKALKGFFFAFNFNQSTEMEVYKSIVECKNLNESHLLVITMLPNYIRHKDKAIMAEIHHLISIHPSEEVRIHYCQAFKEKHYKLQMTNLSVPTLR